ncbi:Uncharacterised protein [[Clostridium] sordellii]|uniref:hypothetical protein n=1 Tax=Paraclostridium sordellii TaxID=1505 RepID=UPI0005E28B41|nr:hypothetical protein [Paeniclostridium sordellii]CEQ11107.1 Uncharacterised protein [[Clostridium] sordellii] [Paeniclostridium sordellii]
MNNSIEKYVETLKRIYIKGELNSKKGEKILKAKARICNLSEEHSQNLKEEVILNFEELENFITDLMESNEGLELYDEDITEIYEFSKDLNLTQEDAKHFIDKLTLDNTINQIQNKIEESEEIKSENFEVIFIDNIELKHPKNINIYKPIIYINEVIEESHINFSEEILKLKNRFDFTYNNVMKIYKYTVIDEIYKLHTYFLKENLICDEIDSNTVVKILCGRIDLIEGFCQSINEINNEAMDKMELMKYINKIEGSNKSIVYGDVGSIIAYNSINGIFNGISNGLKKAKFKSELDKVIYSFILNQVEYLVNTLIDETYKSLMNMKQAGLYKGYTDIYIMKSNKQESEALIENMNKIKDTMSEDEKICKIVCALEKYPFNENAYIELTNLLSKDDIYNKLTILKLADESLKGLKGFEIIKPIYESIEKEIYITEMSNIKINQDINAIKNCVHEIINKYNICDPNIIALTEYEKFGDIISDINKSILSEETKEKMYSMFLNKNLDCGLVELNKHLNEFMIEYNILSYYIYKDIEIIGTVVSNIELDYNNKELRRILEDGYNTVYNRNCKLDLKIEIITDLRKKCKIHNDIAFEIEESLFGQLISATKEDLFYIKIERDALKLYKDLGKNPFGYKFTCCKDSEFSTGKFLNNNYKKIKQNQDKPLFSYIKNSKEGFVITRKSIISSYENKIVNIKDIQSIVYKNTPYKDSYGKILYYESIQIKTNKNKTIELDITNIDKKDAFVEFLYKLLQLNKIDISLENLINKSKTNEIELDSEISLTTDSVESEIEESEYSSKDIDKIEIQNFANLFNLNENKFYNIMKSIQERQDYFTIIKEVYSLLEENLKKNIYFEGSIEGNRKIKNAITSYANLNSKENIIFLFDNTVLGSAKDGFLITDKGIYHKLKFENAWFINHKDIKNIDIDGKSIIINGKYRINISMIDNRYKVKFKEFIEYCSRVITCKIYGFEKEYDDKYYNIGINNTLDINYKIERFINLALNELDSINLKNLLSSAEDFEYNKKLNMAKTKYAYLEQNEKPLLIYDNTAFKSGKEGYLITDKFIYYKNTLGKPGKISISKIYEVRVKGSDLYVNDTNIFCNQVSIRDRSKFEEFTRMILFVLKAINSNPNEIDSILEVAFN